MRREGLRVQLACVIGVLLAGDDDERWCIDARFGGQRAQAEAEGRSRRTEHCNSFAAPNWEAHSIFSRTPTCSRLYPGMLAATPDARTKSRATNYAIGRDWGHESAAALAPLRWLAPTCHAHYRRTRRATAAAVRAIDGMHVCVRALSVDL